MRTFQILKYNFLLHSTVFEVYKRSFFYNVVHIFKELSSGNVLNLLKTKFKCRLVPVKKKEKKKMRKKRKKKSKSFNRLGYICIGNTRFCFFYFYFLEIFYLSIIYFLLTLRNLLLIFSEFYVFICSIVNKEIIIINGISLKMKEKLFPKRQPKYTRSYVP